MDTVSRTTRDVDVIALAAGRGTQAGLQSSDPLPPALVRAIAVVARDLRLAPDWMNNVIAGQWKTGLPPGIETRLVWRTFGALKVGLPVAIDLVFLKLYAAADQPDEGNRHFSDLVALRPSAEQLDAARTWIATQDPTIGASVDRVMSHVRDKLL